MGDVAVHATVDGTLDAPKVSARIEGYDLTLTNPVPAEARQPKGAGGERRSWPALVTPSPWGMPVSVLVEAGYDASVATATAHVTHDEKAILRVDGNVAIPWAGVLNHALEPVGGLRAVLTDVPLGDLRSSPTGMSAAAWAGPLTGRESARRRPR